MVLIGMQKRNGQYFPSYQFSEHKELVTPQPYPDFTSGLVCLLGRCKEEVTSGALREPLRFHGDYEGLTADEVEVIGKVVFLYNQVVGHFPRQDFGLR